MKKASVTLRRRAASGGKESLYLDIYAGGRRRTESLRLQLVPERGRGDRSRNKETMMVAEALRAKRLTEVLRGEYDLERRPAVRVAVLEYLRKVADGKDGSASSRDSWRSMLRHLGAYCDEGTTWDEVDKAWVQGFVEHLNRAVGKNGQGGLAAGTKRAYFALLKHGISRAMGDGLLGLNPAAGVEGFRRVQGERAYLTMDEVRRMAAAECRNAVLKRAFMFSCLTGLRKSDIERLTWGDVHRQGRFTRIIFRQKKTGGQEYLDISDEAVVWMGERGVSGAAVFPGFVMRGHSSVELGQWAVRAGIGKHITFHSARHSFAVMMLELGVDIYTVSKLLGHTDVAVTQVYAHMLDKNKQNAVARIPKILG